MSVARKKTEKLSPKLKVGGYRIGLTNQDKLYFPEPGITKGELIEYYLRMASIMLPYLRDRPLTMHRFPDGIAQEGFYQQRVSEHFPDWIDRVTVPKEDGETITHVVCNHAATLVYLANQGVITPHIWLSRADKPNRPDRMIFDLDPSGESAGWVRQAALIVRDLLVSLELTPFVMTSGSAGFHIVVPLERRYDFETVRAFAQDVAAVLVQQEPDRFTVEHRKDQRGDRIYVDTLRNSYGHTSVAPYAVRTTPNATIATPLRWDEMRRLEIHPQRYTLRNVITRLGNARDPWHEMDDYRQTLSAARSRLKALVT